MTTHLTPETRSILDAMEGLGLPPLHTLTPSEARHMRAEAARLAKDGAEKLEETLKRREQLAVEKIAQAEADAVREVRAMSVDIAVAATRSLIASNMDAAKSGAMVDEAISDLSKKLH